MSNEKLQNYISGLRSFASFLEANADIVGPYDFMGLTVSNYVGKKEDLAVWVKRMTEDQGRVEKKVTDYSLDMTVKFNDVVTLSVSAPRKEVCVPRVVGTKKVTKKVQVTPAVYEDKEVEEEIVEWDCKPVMG